MFLQEKPASTPSIFRSNAFFWGLIKKHMPQSAYLLMAPALESFGEDVINRVKNWGEQAEKNPPTLENFDAFGHRVDRLHLSDGWRKMKVFARQNKLVGVAYDKKTMTCGRTLQAAQQIMFSAYSSTFSCPLAMTDGAVALLKRHAPPSIKEKVLGQLLNEEQGVLCGQWMTENAGGSDLRGVATQAIPWEKEADSDLFGLYGKKWFCSAIDSEYALVLARMGNDGLSLFLVRVWQKTRLEKGIRLNRLKNKLGTRGLATAEVNLEGALGVLVGLKGEGIKTASTLLNITRFYNSLAATSIMNRCAQEALDYAKVRKSFGKLLIEHGPHREVLADIDAKRAGAMALCFEMARLLGKSQELGEESLEYQMARGLIPIAKIVLAKWAVYCASEALEAIGGVGYLEETIFPQMLRDAQVLPIWEGTTNVLVADVIKAQQKNNSLAVLLKNLCERANAVMIDEGDALRILKNRLQIVSQKVMSAIYKSPDDPQIYLELQARPLVFSIATCAMAVLLAEAKPYIIQEDIFAHSRFSTFVSHNLCGHFSM
jgi:acyl-CoA dehydrogenase